MEWDSFDVHDIDDTIDSKEKKKKKKEKENVMKKEESDGMNWIGFGIWKFDEKWNYDWI